MRRRPAAIGNIPLLVASIASGLLLVTLVLAMAPSPQGTIPPAYSPVVSPTPPNRPTTELPNVTFVSAGTVYLVPAGAFEDVLLHLALSGDLSGSYSASANVTGWLLSSSEFRSLETNGTVGQPLWSAGPAPGGTFDLALASGTWYLVFADLDAAVPTEVHITSDIEAIFPTSPAQFTPG